MSITELYQAHLLRMAEKESGEDLHWYLLQIEPTKELKAQKSLIERGFNPYVPLTKDDRRKEKQRSGIPHYPGYLFARLCAGLHGDSFYEVKSAPYVYRFITYGENQDGTPNYAKASDDLIAAMKQEENDMGLRETDLYYKPGDEVYVKTGTFKDRIAEVVKENESDARIMAVLKGDHVDIKVAFKRSEIEPLA